MYIYQTWPYYSEHFDFEKKCVDDERKCDHLQHVEWRRSWLAANFRTVLRITILMVNHAGIISLTPDPESESWSTWKAFGIFDEHYQELCSKLSSKSNR